MTRATLSPAVQSCADRALARQITNGKLIEHEGAVMGSNFTNFISGIAASDTPLPLYAPPEPALPYPIDALGPVLSRAAAAIANKVQVAPAMAAQSVLAVASLAVCPLANVMLPIGQPRPLALFIATVAESGGRKTTSDNEALWPIRQHEKNLRLQYDALKKEWVIDHAAWEAERVKIARNVKFDLDQRRCALAGLGEEPLKPLTPFLKTGDMTIEGLTKGWPGFHAGLGLFTSEGGMVTGGHSMNADNMLKTAAGFSQLWDGGTITRLRAADEASILTGRRPVMNIMIQPDAADGFLSNKVLCDQGLLSRILVARPDSQAGLMLFKETAPADTKAISDFGARILGILERPPALAEGKRNELDPPSLTLTADAVAAWIGFQHHVEKQRGKDGKLSEIRDFAAKAAEQAARIAGIITIVNNPDAEFINEPEMVNAAILMNWYLHEAERLKQAGVVSLELRRANDLLKWLQARPDGIAPFREILQFGPKATRTKAAAEEAIGILGNHGQIVPQEQARPRLIQAVRP
jgi:hypothetical protein